MSRLALSIKNAWIALVFQLIYVFVQFYARDIFLDHLGDEFMGIESTLKSMLQFLNLSELGIGTAVGFTLYKPIFNNNRDKINEIIGYLGFLYKRIGLFVLLAGLILILFFPLFFKGTDTSLGYIIFLFISLLISNLLNYFFTYQMFLLEADQKNYVRLVINQSVFVGRLIVQCFVLLYLKDIFLWILLELIAPFFYVVLLRRKIRKTYPWLNFNYRTTQEIRQKHRTLLTKIKQISFHKIGSFVSNGTDNILIFAFINPATVAYVVNYQLVLNNINVLVSKFFAGSNASVGNLVAENDLKNITKVFWEMMALRFFLAGTSAIMFYIGFEDLIVLWLGEKYLLSPGILIALICIFFILQIRQPVDSFKQAYGLYADIWSPLAQSIINLAFSILLILKYGVIGVFIGTIISQVCIVLIWRPYYLFDKGFKLPSSIYWKGFIFHVLYFLIIGLLYMSTIDPLLEISFKSKFLNLVVRVISSGILFGTIYFIVLQIFSKGFKDLTKRFYQIIKNKIYK
ncbi:lipopolysaccharide biosynthesis protein [Zhouia amylolytica]|uniref:Sugar transporter n=1 Tax=Zhouia amylolytica AD3 TaxID=1286632 RepID=W2UQE1_9FLAO|nr:hypothetical protein [Zhouia amylolytica]ETN96218.1 hypothetical protein P278_09120 [Zhouia amylolytica AD3]